MHRRSPRPSEGNPLPHRFWDKPGSPLITVTSLSASPSSTLEGRKLRAPGGPPYSPCLPGLRSGCAGGPREVQPPDKLPKRSHNDRVRTPPMVTTSGVTGEAATGSATQSSACPEL